MFPLYRADPYRALMGAVHFDGLTIGSMVAGAAGQVTREKLTTNDGAAHQAAQSRRCGPSVRPISADRRRNPEVQPTRQHAPGGVPTAVSAPTLQPRVPAKKVAI